MHVCKRHINGPHSFIVCCVCMNFAFVNFAWHSFAHKMTHSVCSQYNNIILCVFLMWLLRASCVYSRNTKPSIVYPYNSNAMNTAFGLCGARNARQAKGIISELMSLSIIRIQFGIYGLRQILCCAVCGVVLLCGCRTLYCIWSDRANNCTRVHTCICSVVPSYGAEGCIATSQRILSIE